MIEVLFFSGSNCGVCHALEPKVRQLIKEKYDEYIDYEVTKVEVDQERAAQHLVFTLPVLIVKKESREVKRFVRAFGVHQVDEFLARLISQVV